MRNERCRTAIVERMLTVTLPRNFWDWLALWSTVAAAVLALFVVGFAAWAIRRGNVLARDTDLALVRERRMTFELSVLL